MTGSPAYWEAVNRTYQKVIEQTQPNYTVMQRAGIQRNPNEMLKQLTMFTTQRFQNYGVLTDAIGDYRAQAERYRQNQSDENKAELQRAKTQRNRAVVSQAAQTAVFAIMKIGADFLLHRWDREHGRKRRCDRVRACGNGLQACTQKVLRETFCTEVSYTA